MDERSHASGHVLHIEARNRIIVTEVLDVGMVSEDGISAMTKAGGLHMRGRGLKVIRLDAATGELEVTGEVQAVSYTEEQHTKSWLARVFR